jgi:four helix bundle protein
MTPDELKARTKRFALEILKMSESIPKTLAGRTMAGQLIRAATSVAANYRAACYARSRAEFASKIGVVLEEADESTFWLELLQESGILCSPELKRLSKEAGELTSIMAASRKKVTDRRF